MARKIKFRGKNSKDEWVYGSLIINETENEKGKFQVAFIVQGLPCASDGGDFYTARMERVKIETIGQYTGLDDNKGNEIYEGDIVKKHDPYNVNTSDYLIRTEEWQGDIITNPPYSKAQEFVEKSLSLVSDGSKVAMFLKLMFLEGKKRRTLFEKHPPRRIWVSSSRLKCAINGDFDNTGTSATAYAWYVWVKGYKGSPEVRWFN